MPVRVHTESESRIIFTVPPFSEGLIAPSKLEFVRFIVRLDKSSITILPLIFWLSAFNVTLPPLRPEEPHFWASALKKIPALSLLTIPTSVRFISASVFVTQNISPVVFVIVPPVIENFPSPFDASPESD